MSERFKLGDEVQWTSQANARTKEKRGVIVAVVPAGRRPDREQFARLHRGSGVGLPRDHESYVVHVRTKDYWPRVGHLRRVVAVSQEQCL